MFERILAYHNRLTRCPRRANRSSRSVVLEIGFLEERCTPAVSAVPAAEIVAPPASVPILLRVDAEKPPIKIEFLAFSQPARNDIFQEWDNCLASSDAPADEARASPHCEEAEAPPSNGVSENLVVSEEEWTAILAECEKRLELAQG